MFGALRLELGTRLSAFQLSHRGIVDEGINIPGSLVHHRRQERDFDDPEKFDAVVQI